jgi:hypothetical protein
MGPARPNGPHSCRPEPAKIYYMEVDREHIAYTWHNEKENQISPLEVTALDASTSGSSSVAGDFHRSPSPIAGLASWEEGRPGSRPCVSFFRFLKFLYRHHGEADVDGASRNNGLPIHASARRRCC